MKSLNASTAHKTIRPERIVQFGEGNFLRAFVDWIIQKMNQKTDFNGNVVIVQPLPEGRDYTTFTYKVLNRETLSIPWK